MSPTTTTAAAAEERNGNRGSGAPLWLKYAEVLTPPSKKEMSTPLKG